MDDDERMEFIYVPKLVDVPMTLRQMERFRDDMRKYHDFEEPGNLELYRILGVLIDSNSRPALGAKQ